jgi:hypothetical protein
VATSLLQRLCLAIALLVAAAACGGGSGNGSGEGETERRVTNACRLITDQDAERILGGAPVTLPLGQAPSAAVHVCAYREPRAGLELLVRSVEASNTVELYRSLVQTAPAEPVPNLGREAVLLGQSSLVVLVDDTLRLEVSVRAGGQLDRGRTVTTAETALRRLAED